MGVGFHFMSNIVLQVA